MDSVAISRTDPSLKTQHSPRPPASFQSRVIDQFRSPQNFAYLHTLLTRAVELHGGPTAGPRRAHALATLHDALFEYSSGTGRALEVLASDPTAQRGALRPAVGLWDEVRRLNYAFYKDRLALLREQGRTTSQTIAGGCNDCLSDEPYHLQMFAADSLHPPGLEHLNGGEEAQHLSWNTRGARTVPCRGGTQDSCALAMQHPRDIRVQDDLNEVFIYGDDDAPWSRGSPDRTPEQALAEYWGDGHVATPDPPHSWDTHANARARVTPGQSPITPASARARVTPGQSPITPASARVSTTASGHAYGTAWRDDGGTRFMRREAIPFWQQGGRGGYDLDIDETLGDAPRELDGHVRRWGGATENARYRRAQGGRAQGGP